MSASEVPELGDQVLLAIDTAIGTSVAVGARGRVFEAASDDTRGHAEAIGLLIARAFDEAGVEPGEVTGVVAGIGPGPFTGLRVGIAAAHAFATGRRVPMLPLQGHEAVALEVLDRAGGSDPGASAAGDTAENGADDGVDNAAGGRGGSPELRDRSTEVRVLQDAKRRELFVTEFLGLDDDGIPVRVSEPHLVTRADLVPEPRDVWPERISAATLVKLAARRIAAGRDFESDRALYLRAPDVKEPGAPKKVIPAGG